MTTTVSVEQTRQWISANGELALIDVRELGQHGAGHPFFAVPIPFSVFETRVGRLLPSKAVRIVLVDQNDGVALRAAQIAADLGYSNVLVMEGGAPAWAAAGHSLFDGVHLPSKTFGELLEIARRTPRITAKELDRRQQTGDNLVVIDGRPFEEYTKTSIPGGLCCPNGELALRIGDIVPDAETTIVINCAGRTRSILGAQTLIDMGIPNQVAALENGTQGWFLAGLALDRGKTSSYPVFGREGAIPGLQNKAAALCKRVGAGFISAGDAAALMGEGNRTTYLFDVRTAEEFERDGLAAAVHAPGGQLVQATDQWVGVKGARLIIVDNEMVRAPVVAYWLAQLGHETYVIEGGMDALRSADLPDAVVYSPAIELPADISACELDNAEDYQVVDIRGSQRYREHHIRQAQWSIRPRLGRLTLDSARPVVIVSDGTDKLQLFIHDLRRTGVASPVYHLDTDAARWESAGLEIVSGGDHPADQDCIDFIFHTHERHRGNADAARAYLEWETGLVDRLDPQERGVFRISGP